MTREKLKIIPGVPFVCTLETTEGRPMTSRFHDGTEYLYNVDHRGAPSMLYLPVEGHLAIKRLQPSVGDEIRILKAQAQGQAPVFTVQFVSDAALAPLAAPQPMQASAAVASGVRMLAPRSQVAPAPHGGYASQTQPDKVLHSYDEAVKEPRSYGPVAGYAPSEEPATAGVMLAQCLMQAVDAALGAERYAASKGREVLFLSDDIRAMALTLVINKQREGR